MLTNVVADNREIPESRSGEEQAPLSHPRIQLALIGHLTESALMAALDRADLELGAARSRAALIVNCLTMTGYDSAARSLFVSWNSRHKRKFSCVAVITKNKLWHMVVSSMSLASGQKMKAFTDPADAEPWISEQGSRQGH